MTTIAYRDGTIACDSQLTDEIGTRSARAKKIRKLRDGSLIGVCGSWAPAYRLMQALDEHGELTPAMIESCKGAFALHIRTDKSAWMIEGGKRGGHAPLLGPYFAEGSGSIAALAAFKMGATAAQAVQIAAELDTCSSLPIFTEKLGEPVKKPRRKRVKVLRS